MKRIALIVVIAIFLGVGAWYFASGPATNANPSITLLEVSEEEIKAETVVEKPNREIPTHHSDASKESMMPKDDKSK